MTVTSEKFNCAVSFDKFPLFDYFVVSYPFFWHISETVRATSPHMSRKVEHNEDFEKNTLVWWDLTAFITAFCFRVSQGHHDLKLLVVGSQLFVDCSWPRLNLDCWGALQYILSLYNHLWQYAYKYYVMHEYSWSHFTCEYCKNFPTVKTTVYQCNVMALLKANWLQQN